MDTAQERGWEMVDIYRPLIKIHELQDEVFPAARLSVGAADSLEQGLGGAQRGKDGYSNYYEGKKIC